MTRLFTHWQIEFRSAAVWAGQLDKHLISKADTWKNPYMHLHLSYSELA
jgi:hypothetical protein